MHHRQTLLLAQLLCKPASEDLHLLYRLLVALLFRRIDTSPIGRKRGAAVTRARKRFAEKFPRRGIRAVQRDGLAQMLYGPRCIARLEVCVSEPEAQQCAILARSEQLLQAQYKIARRLLGHAIF